VDKIFGPGNQYVLSAKLMVSIDPDGCPIDMPAGPSEVLIIADETANPEFVAADLLSKAEHGRDSQVVLVSTSPPLSEKAEKELNSQLKALPNERREMAEQTLKNSLSVIASTIEQAIDLANLYAPEHLILNVKEPEKYIPKIKNAGSVFVGGFSPESAGDYASGTNHPLPTLGYAKSFGGVSVESFIKKITFQKLTKEGLNNVAETVEALSDIEQMPAHKRAVVIRKTDKVK